MNRGILSLAACMLVTLVLGSVHAFSIFLAPLEQQLGLPRSQISLVYSFALVSITLSVTLGYRIYAKLPAWWLVAVTALMAGGGLLLAATASGWWMLFAGYSLLFGISNGVGYGYCLQLSAREMPENSGFAMGAVTAAYAVGSILFAQVISWRIEVDSVASALVTLALAVALLGVAAALVLRLVGASYGEAVPAEAGGDRRFDGSRLLKFWLAYLCSVFAGLMAIGHAAGIAQAEGADSGLATAAAMTVGVGSALGGFISGWLVDRWPCHRFLVGLPLLSMFALLAIGASGQITIVVVLLGVVGFAYGSIIAIYPVAIARVYGERGPEAYGRVFIAWGFAGLAAPWCAGIVYDGYGGYWPALLIAAAVALLSSVSAALFRLGKAA